MNKSDWLAKCKKRKLDERTAQRIVAKPTREECRMYFCAECRAWHVTSKPKRTAAIIIGEPEA